MNIFLNVILKSKKLIILKKIVIKKFKVYWANAFNLMRISMSNPFKNSSVWFQCLERCYYLTLTRLINKLCKIRQNTLWSHKLQIWIIKLLKCTANLSASIKQNQNYLTLYFNQFNIYPLSLNGIVVKQYWFFFFIFNSKSDNFLFDRHNFLIT